jgi:hypothetical protein
LLKESDVAVDLEELRCKVRQIILFCVIPIYTHLNLFQFFVQAYACSAQQLLNSCWAIQLLIINN